MKVVFKGVVEEARKGCKVCGGRSFNRQMVTHKAYYLPTGRHVYFRVGRAEEVTEAEAEFLLSLNPEDTKQKVFDVWPG